MNVERMLAPSIATSVSLRDLLSENGPRTRIVFRKDSIYVHPTVHQQSPRNNSGIPTIPLQKRHDNIPGCIFLIEEQPQKQPTPKTSPRNNKQEANDNHETVQKNQLYFTWTPYSMLAGINDRLVAHTKENGEIVTAKNFLSSSPSPSAISPNDIARLKLSQRHQKSRSASDIPQLDNILMAQAQQNKEMAPLDTRNLTPEDGYVSANINQTKPLNRESTGIINSLSPTHHKTVQQHQLLHQQAKEQQNMQDLYAIVCPVTDISCFKRHIPTMGWSYIIVTLKNGISQPPLYFHDGGMQEFFRELHQYVRLIKSKEDESTLFISDEYEPLQKSLAQFNFDEYFEDMYKTNREFSWLETGSKIFKSAKGLKNSFFGGTNESEENVPTVTSTSTPLSTTSTASTGPSPIQAKLNMNYMSQDKPPLAPTTQIAVSAPAPAPVSTTKVEPTGLVERFLKRRGSQKKSDDKPSSTSTPPTPAPAITVNNKEDDDIDKGFEFIDQPESQESIQQKEQQQQQQREEEEEMSMVKEDLTSDVEVPKPEEAVQEEEEDNDDSWGRNHDDPLSAKEWQDSFDSEGRIKNIAKLRRIIFYGGVAEEIRKDVWKYLLGYYSFESTAEERAKLDKEKREEYYLYKDQWTSITPKQESRYSLYRERQSRVDKDVVRTDRTHPFFKEESSVYLKRLYDILVTYSFYNFDLGYCQGMGDLASPILVVMQDEVEAYWCFASLMETMERNFQINSDGMEKQLQALSKLVKWMDRDLFNYLYEHDSINFFFCFRWVLVHFKREFSFDDTMRLWESIWSQHMGSNFHLFLCYAILEMHKKHIMGHHFAFDDILKYCIDLSGHMNVKEVLQNAEIQVLLYRKKMEKLRQKYNDRQTSAEK